MTDQNKYTIVGWGLAGSTLAWQLYERKIPFQVIDDGKNISSRVAAGMVNPIIFKRLTKGWRVDELMSYAHKFYSKIEEKTASTFLSHKSIVRIFSSIEEQNSWSSLSGDERFSEYLNPASDLNLTAVNAPYGVGYVNSMGHLKVPEFLDASREYFEKQNIQFIDKDIFESPLNHEQYVFCQGAALLTDSNFSYVLIKPTHGDILTIKAPDFSFDDILNKNMFVLPLGDHLYKIGATYNWEQTEAVPTQAGKDELIERLTTFCHFDFQIVAHEAGIRPTLADRKPVLGTHFSKKNLHIFNGLGTKGVSIAPFFANQLAAYLIDGNVIDMEVDVKRFEKHLNM